MKKKIVISLAVYAPSIGSILNVLSGEGMDIMSFEDDGTITGYFLEENIENLGKYQYFKTVQIEDKTNQRVAIDMRQYSSAN